MLFGKRYRAGSVIRGKESKCCGSNKWCSLCSSMYVVMFMYGITMGLLLLNAVVTFFCKKDVWFAKAGVLVTYMLTGFFGGLCRRCFTGFRKWLPLLMYMGIWYVIMLGTGKNGAKDWIQLAIITVIVSLSYVLGGIFHKY